MTIAQLYAALEGLDPSLRVLIPGQEWGWVDVADTIVRHTAYAPVPRRPDMGGWVTAPVRNPRARRERCVLILPHPSRRDPPPAA